MFAWAVKETSTDFSSDKQRAQHSFFKILDQSPGIKTAVLVSTASLDWTHPQSTPGRTSRCATSRPAQGSPLARPTSDMQRLPGSPPPEPPTDRARSSSSTCGCPTDAAGPRRLRSDCMRPKRTNLRLVRRVLPYHTAAEAPPHRAASPAGKLCPHLSSSCVTNWETLAKSDA